MIKKESNGKKYVAKNLEEKEEDEFNEQFKMLAKPDLTKSKADQTKPNIISSKIKIISRKTLSQNGNTK